MANPAEIDEPEDEIVFPPELTPEEARTAQIEAEARRQGWRPQDEYRGPAGQWRSAEDFLKRGQDILPMVRKDLLKERERANNMESEIKALRSTVDDQKLVMDDLLKMARNASEAGYKRAMDELKAQQRAAAQQGDVAAVVAIGEKITEVQEERASAAAVPQPKAKEAAPEVKPAVKVAPEVELFVQENPWFNTDTQLHRAMETEHMNLLEESPGLPLEENLRLAKEAVMARYPRKFGINTKKAPDPEEEEEPIVTPRRNTVSAPSAPAGGGRAPKTGIASIENPQERQIAQMAFSRAKRLMPAITEAEWFQIYQDPKADVIEMIDTSKAAKRKS